MSQLARLSKSFEITGRYPEFYPAVVTSKQLSRVGTEDKYSVLIMNSVLVQKKALESQNACSFFKVSDTRWYNFCRTTRVQEIRDYGQPGQHELADGEGSGYVWRYYSITRFEEQDGGVYVELEAMALTRDIPASLRWMAGPIIRRVSRSSVLSSLQRTQQAVESTIAGVPVRREIAGGEPRPGPAKSFR